jgi:putative ABC transport system permease protein
LVLVRGGNRALLQGEVHAFVQRRQPEMPRPTVQSLDEVIGASVARQRYETTLLVLFAVTGLVLVLVGVFGVVAYAVRQRTTEIGIRLAMGAPPSRVVGSIVRRGMMSLLIGSAVGVAGAVVASRFVEQMLFGTTPLDVRAYAAAMAILAVAGLVACYLPARAAARLDPVVALRQG